MSGTGSDNGWLEAAVAWEVCASLHRQYCKGKDALFTTRQSDFVKHAENARGRASHGQAPAHNTVSLSPLPNPAHNERVYGGHGNEIVHSYYTEYQMREYARQEVFRAEEAWQARATADSVTAPAGGVDAAVDAIALARYKVVPAHESMFHRFAVVAGDGKQQLYLGREVECENMARKFAGAFLDGAFYQANITPSTQAAGSVPAVEREQERIAFKDAHRHLELYEVPDAWGRPMFKHSHVEASWLGWIARASHGQAPAPTHEQIAAYLESTGAYVTNDATREAAIAEAIDTDRAKRGQAPATEDSVLEDAARYRWLRINAIGAFRTNDGNGPVSIYHLSKIPAIPGIPEETDAAIDTARKQGGV